MLGTTDLRGTDLRNRARKAVSASTSTSTSASSAWHCAELLPDAWLKTSQRRSPVCAAVMTSSATTGSEVYYSI